MWLTLWLALGLANAADTGVWTSTSFIHDFRPGTDHGLLGWADLHTRRTGPSMLGIARGAVGIRLAEGFTVWGGYGWIPTLFDEGDATHEHRAWEQAILARDLAGGQAQLRVRQEQRSKVGASGVAHRTRVLIRYAHPLPDEAWLAIAWNELFVEWTDPGWVGYHGLDQNRTFLGVGLKGVAPGTRFELGWMGLTLWRAGAPTLTHVANFSLSWVS